MAKRPVPSKPQPASPAESAAPRRPRRARPSDPAAPNPAATPPAEAAEPRGDEVGPETVRERIARRAYEIYTRRGGQHGLDLDDWLRAEQEITGGKADVEG